MSQWDEFVRLHPWGSIYHTSAWRAIIQTTYSVEPFYFALVDETNRILAGLPFFKISSFLTGKRISTLPCAQSCDPLVSSEKQYLELRNHIIQFAKTRALSAWEMKASHLFPFENEMKQASSGEYFTYVLSIDKETEALFANIHKMLKRALKRANRTGLSVKRCDSLEGVRRFHDLYLQMRRRKGLLPQPCAFFENLWKVLSAEGRIDILFAEYHGILISAVLLLKYRDKIIYEYGATQRGAHRFSPSPFLLWGAIQQAKSEGFVNFDFGRTASTEVTLSSFKKRWGGELQPFSYCDILKSGSSKPIRQNRSIKMLMGILMQSLPPSACEYAGRLLYKHVL